MVQKGSKKEERDAIRKWIIYSLIYGLAVGIIYGTAHHYFGVLPLLFGWYIDLSWTIIFFALSIWAIVTYYFKKKYKIKLF